MHVSLKLTLVVILIYSCVRELLITRNFTRFFIDEKSF